MAGALKDQQLAKLVYASLQAASCPWVEGLDLQGAHSMLQVLCAPSQHRTDMLAWICSSINPNFATSKAMLMRCQDPDGLTKEMAMLGQELMLCTASDLDLIRGVESPHRQLLFLEQLLTLVPGRGESAGPRLDEEMLLNELYAADNLPHLAQMLKPTFDPWPSHIKALRKGTKSSSKPSREEDADVAALLQSAQAALQQLQSHCEFLKSEAQSPGIFSPSSLRLALCDLQQLISTFNHIYETDLKAYCNRDPPSFSTEATVFQRVHQLLMACNTELEMLNEVSEASGSMTEEVNWLQTQPLYWRRGEKHTLPHKLEELIGLSREFLSLLHS